MGAMLLLGNPARATGTLCPDLSDDDAAAVPALIIALASSMSLEGTRQLRVQHPTSKGCLY